MTSEVESIRAALRGQRLPALAAELGVQVPVLEAFTCDRANLTPALLASISKILTRRQNTPASVPRNAMKLTARALKCTATLDPAGLHDPGGAARVTLEIAVGGKNYSADVASKSVRKCRATISENGAENVVLLIQGRLEGNAIVEAGLVAQVKLPRPEVNGRP